LDLSQENLSSKNVVIGPTYHAVAVDRCYHTYLIRFAFCQICFYQICFRFYLDFIYFREGWLRFVVNSVGLKGQKKQRGQQ
jgi:hypothetical protein